MMSSRLVGHRSFTNVWCSATQRHPPALLLRILLDHPRCCSYSAATTAATDSTNKKKPKAVFLNASRLNYDGQLDFSSWHELVDVTLESGLSGAGIKGYPQGVAVGDYDNDGRPDLFVSCVGKHALFRNVDGKKITEEHVAELANWTPNAPRRPSAFTERRQRACP